MGNNGGIVESQVRDYIEREFGRVRREGERNYLKVGELVQIQPMEEYCISFMHIPTLFLVDTDHDG